MKIISNNVWGGQIHKPLFEFIKSHSSDTDIFCFQEVFHRGQPVPGHEGESRMELFSEISELLPGFDGYLAPKDSHEESLAMFVRKTIAIDKIGYIFVHGANSARTEGIPLQYLQFKIGGKQYTICNFHGWWSGESQKRDTPERLEQSRNVKIFLSNISGAKIICGDFNLAPDTESLLILEEGMTNLIKKYDISSTRSHFYKKDLRFADYALVSPEVSVTRFEVLENAVSDHLPMLLEFT